jgi:hypothetical protein
VPWDRIDERVRLAVVEAGARAPLLVAGERVGYWLRTKAGTRPLAVHAAWRIDPETAAEVVLATTSRARTPEPLRRARQAARTAARTGVSCRHVATGSNKEDAMADTVQRVDYLYVTVPDTPGEGIRILAALREKGLNLLAYLGFPAGDGQSQIDLVADDAGALRQAVEEIGLSASETKRAFLTEGEDRPGAVAETTARLAQANVNVIAAAATRAGSGHYGMILWVAPADYERAADALEA